MSLIVDINPVPWEILEQVKARLLKNRAKKQKRQPEKGKELRRVMQVDNGILAKQRWEEPSFIGGRDRVFAIVFGVYIEFIGMTQIPISYTVRVNGSVVGNVTKRYLSNKAERHVFIWSSSDSDLEKVIALNTFPDGLEVIDIVTVIETEQPDPEGVTIVELSNIVYPYIVLPPVFTAYFFDDEFTKYIYFNNNPNGSGYVDTSDTTLTYLLENWKPS